jgi:hypothetical protein
VRLFNRKGGFSHCAELVAQVHSSPYPHQGEFKLIGLIWVILEGGLILKLLTLLYFVRQSKEIWACLCGSHFISFLFVCGSAMKIDYLYDPFCFNSCLLVLDERNVFFLF